MSAHFKENEEEEKQEISKHDGGSINVYIRQLTDNSRNTVTIE